MTPKEKAKELVRRYSCYCHGIEFDVNFEVEVHHDAIFWALKTVEELIKETDWSETNYWLEVKTEIEKL